MLGRRRRLFGARKRVVAVYLPIFEHARDYRVLRTLEDAPHTYHAMPTELEFTVFLYFYVVRRARAHAQSAIDAIAVGLESPA